MNLAIIGASGNVGRKTIEILEKSNLSFNNLYLVASTKSSGKKIKFRKKEIEIDLDKVKKFDIDLQTSAHKKLSSAAKSKEDIKSPLQANTNVSRDEIVAAGKKLYQQTGLQRQSLREIAAEMHMDLDGISKYFKSRYELKQAICEKRLQELNEQFYAFELPPEIEALPPLEKAQAFIAATLDDVDYTGYNGEPIHQDVFLGWINGSLDGEILSLPNEQITKTFTWKLYKFFNTKC
mgnify:CR=1 FL=1